MPATAPKRSLDSLDDAQQNFLNAEMVYEEATAKRDSTIQALLAAGYRQRDIAARLGISRGRVAQIVARGPRTVT